MERYVIEYTLFCYLTDTSLVSPVQKLSSECDRSLRLKIPRSLFLFQQGKRLPKQSIANFPLCLNFLYRLVLAMFPALVKVFSRTGRHSENLIIDLWIFLHVRKIMLPCHLLLFLVKLRRLKNLEKRQDRQLHDQRNSRFAFKMVLQVTLPVSVLHLQRAAQEHGTRAMTVVRVAERRLMLTVGLRTIARNQIAARRTKNPVLLVGIASPLIAQRIPTKSTQQAQEPDVGYFLM